MRYVELARDIVCCATLEDNGTPKPSFNVSQFSMSSAGRMCRAVSWSRVRRLGIDVTFKCSASYCRFGFRFIFDSVFGSVFDSSFDSTFDSMFDSLVVTLPWYRQSRKEAIPYAANFPEDPGVFRWSVKFLGHMGTLRFHWTTNFSFRSAPPKTLIYSKFCN